MATGGQKLAAVLLFIAFICAIIALAVPHWTFFEISGNEFRIGLWSGCRSVGGLTTCDDISPEDWCTVYVIGSGNISLDADACKNGIQAVRAFSVLGFIFAFLAVVTVCAAFFAGKMGAMPPALLAGICGFCELLSFAIFTGSFKNDGAIKYGAGVAFAIITWLLQWTCALLVFKSGGAAAGGGSASG